MWMVDNIATSCVIETIVNSITPLRQAPQKEGGWKLLCDLPPVGPRLVNPTNLTSRINGEKTQHILLMDVDVYWWDRCWCRCWNWCCYYVPVYVIYFHRVRPACLGLATFLFFAGYFLVLCWLLSCPLSSVYFPCFPPNVFPVCLVCFRLSWS